VKSIRRGIMGRVVVVVVVALVSVAFFCAPAGAQTSAECVTKGDEAYKAQQYEQAVELYTKALGLDAKQPQTVYKRGLSYYNLQKWQDARSDFERVAQANPQSHEAFFYLGQTYFWDKDFDRAVLNYQ